MTLLTFFILHTIMLYFMDHLYYLFLELYEIFSLYLVFWLLCQVLLEFLKSFFDVVDESIIWDEILPLALKFLFHLRLGSVLQHFYRFFLSLNLLSECVNFRDLGLLLLG